MLQDPLTEKVDEAIRRFDLLRRGERVVVGVSGGPDSSALLAVLSALRERWNLHLVAAHLDHGLRGASAQRDAETARALARRFGAAWVMERADVAAAARRERTSIEAAGRRCRYDFFHRVARRHGCTRIAVGHHLDDQTETILYRLLTGAGSDGLSGMRPRRGTVIRPLLGCRRSEIRDFLERHQVAFREDPSNRSPRHLRNRIRHRLLPWLQREFNPRVQEALWHSARLLADEVDYLEGEAEKEWRRLRLDLPGGIWLDGPGLTALHPALRRRVLRRAVWALASGRRGLPRLGALHVGKLEEVAAGRMAAVDLPGGIRAEHQQGRLHLAGEGRLQRAPATAATRLTIPGRIALWHPWVALRARVLEGQEPSKLQLAEPGHAYLDYEVLGEPEWLEVRAREPGDRLHPLGAPGTRKLQDLMVDRRVPRQLRDLLPVVTDGRRLLWVVGVAIAHPFRIRPATRRVLHLHLENGPEGCLLP